MGLIALPADIDLAVAAMFDAKTSYRRGELSATEYRQLAEKFKELAPHYSIPFDIAQQS